MGFISRFAGSRRGYLLALGLLIAIGPLLVAAPPARAATTFTVDRVTDAADRNLDDGVCDTDRRSGIQCTLRAAIQQSNASTANDTIYFNLPGGGVRTIRPTSPLPDIIDTVTINGYILQPEATPNTATVGTNARLRVEIDGSLLQGQRPLANGLVFRLAGAGGSIIRGLIINNFPSSGVAIGREVRGVKIAGNFIGTNADGTAARGNKWGITVGQSSNVVIGGTARADRNLISGNASQGVELVSGSSVSGYMVQGNLIGTQRDGRSVLGNGATGVRLISARNVTIGGESAAAANTIAYNGEDGVEVVRSGQPSIGNRVLRNSIFANGELGIDLDSSLNGDDGPEPNDPGDGDSGANGRQNTPIITSAVTSGGVTTVRGILNSTPNASFLIQVFSDRADEGKTFRGEVRVQTNASGNAQFVVRTANPIAASDNVTATATGDDGTSEFSPAF